MRMTISCHAHTQYDVGGIKQNQMRINCRKFIVGLVTQKQSRVNYSLGDMNYEVGVICWCKNTTSMWICTTLDE